MKTIWIGAVAACLALNLSFAAQPKKAEPKEANAALSLADSVEQEFQKLLSDDDTAQAEADKWIQDAKAFEQAGAGLPTATLTAKIEQRFASVRKSYEGFLQRHPDHARARLAYGSFLNDIQEEDAAVVQWEKAKEMDPTNPAAWNNLANHYGHRGPIKKAFEYYEKAIELDSNEALYYQNLATTTYLFREDAKEFYRLTDEQVYDRALDLYRKALKLDPKNFPLATDYAQTFYGIRPPRVEQAIEAWNYALEIANDGIERQGVYLHLARIELNSNRFEEARRHLAAVSHDMYKVLKNRLIRNLVAKQKSGNSSKPQPPKSLDVSPR